MAAPHVLLLEEHADCHDSRQHAKAIAGRPLISREMIRKQRRRRAAAAKTPNSIG